MKTYTAIMSGIDIETGMVVSGNAHTIVLNPNIDERDPYTTGTKKVYLIESFDRNPNEPMKFGIDTWVVKEGSLHPIDWREEQK